MAGAEAELRVSALRQYETIGIYQAPSVCQILIKYSWSSLHVSPMRQIIPNFQVSKVWVRDLNNLLKAIHKIKELYLPIYKSKIHYFSSNMAPKFRLFTLRKYR